MGNMPTTLVLQRISLLNCSNILVDEIYHSFYRSPNGFSMPFRNCELYCTLSSPAASRRNTSSLSNSTFVYFLGIKQPPVVVSILQQGVPFFTVHFLGYSPMPGDYFSIGIIFSSAYCFFLLYHSMQSYLELL